MALTKRQLSEFETWWLADYPEGGDDPREKAFALNGFEYGITNQRLATRRLLTNPDPETPLPKTTVWFSEKESTPDEPVIAFRQYQEIEHLTLTEVAKLLEKVKEEISKARTYTKEVRVKLIPVQELKPGDVYEDGYSDYKHTAVTAPEIVPNNPWHSRVAVTVEIGGDFRSYPLDQPVRLISRKESK
jgi:hypothetical protein